MFNFGLHDLQKAESQAELDLYSSQLTNITEILLASGAKHVQYALTTPFQADATPGCGSYCSPGPTTPPTNLLNFAPTPYPQPLNGGNGRCGPPVCVEDTLGCGVPNATAKAHSPDPNAPGCGPPTFAVSKLNARAATIMTQYSVPSIDLN